MSDLLALLLADPRDDPGDPPAPRACSRGHADAQGPTPDPFARKGLTYAQAQALVAELERIERAAKGGLERLRTGHAVSGVSALTKVYNGVRDAKAWAARDLDEANPSILHVEVLP